MSKRAARPESEILREVLVGVGARPGIRLFRNSVGVARLAGGGALRFGLCPGSADLIGWQTLPSGIARFVALEVKTEVGRLTPEQERFLDAVRRAGGAAGEVRSVADALDALEA